MHALHTAQKERLSIPDTCLHLVTISVGLSVFLVLTSD